jgi:hypothetical protein
MVTCNEACNSIRISFSIGATVVPNKSILLSKSMRIQNFCVILDKSNNEIEFIPFNSTSKYSILVNCHNLS